MRHASPALALRLASLAASLTLAGCAEEFTPGSIVEDERILALVAEPPELDGRVAGASTRVSAVEAAPVPAAGASPAAPVRTWTFCPFSLGASTAFRCAVPQCETALVPEADGAVVVEPLALASACLAQFGGALPPDLAGGGLPEKVEVVVRHRVAWPRAGGQPPLEREAVQRVPVWTVAPTSALNAAPAFAAAPLRFSTAQGAEAPAAACADPSQPDTAACPRAGTLPRGGRVAIEAAVTPASFETYQAAGRTIAESLTISFFSTAGRFTDERGAPTPEAPATSTELKHEKLVGDPRWVLVWAVLRDLRGGQAVAGPYLLEVPAAN